ncbi:MAG: CoA transferase [Dehalococcoidia bacterium]
MPGAFEGVRIVDCTQGVAGPMATMILADHGADVVKVESPGGDRLQDHPGYITWSRNKRLVTIDRDSFDGQQQILTSSSCRCCHLRRPTPASSSARARLRDTRRCLPGAAPRLAPNVRRTRPLESASHEDFARGRRWWRLAQFSWEGVPVHLVSPQVAHGHAMTAATAIAAGLVERAETGAGQSLVCTGSPLRFRRRPER